MDKLEVLLLSWGLDPEDKDLGGAWGAHKLSAGIY